MENPSQKSSSPFLWGAAGVLLLALLFARAIYPEILSLTVVLAVMLVGVLGTLVSQNRKALRGRSAAYGLNSAVTIVLVIAIVGVLNFLASRYPQKLDLTKNKLHTLSDQTDKLVKGLKTPVKATLFAKIAQREQFRPLLDNYKALNPKFEVEYVDPDREPTRAKQANIKKYGTLLLTVGPRESKVEDLTEEKLTNALIKLLKDKSPTLCAITGHGERSFDSNEADGYAGIKKSLNDQAYEVKNLNLLQDSVNGKIPDVCDAVAIIGPTKAFFTPEAKELADYLDNGGHALIALDLNIKGGEYAPELLAILKDWYVKTDAALIVDPLSRMLGVDASVPLLATFSKDNPITKDFATNCYFPFARPVSVLTGAPQGLTVQWLAQTTPKAFGVSDMKALQSGQVQEGKDFRGPLQVAVAVDGKKKDAKASRNSRLVVFGSAGFASNNWSRYGGNLDLFMNSVSWVMEDESLISIRAKEEGPGRVELSQKQGTFIGLMTVLVIPLLIASAGVVIWFLRKRM